MMKKIGLWLLTAALFWGGCSNLELVEKRDEAGRLVERFTIDPRTKLKEGMHETFYASSGSKSEDSRYHAGVLRGEQVFYYESGQVQEVRNFDDNGSFSGAYKSYFENGLLKSEGQYENGSMSGKWKFFYKSGNIKEIVHFRNNVENGPFIEFHENGKISAEGNYANELENGLLKIYNENGELTVQKQCENGICRTVWKSDISKDSAKKL